MYCIKCLRLIVNNVNTQKILGSFESDPKEVSGFVICFKILTISKMYSHNYCFRDHFSCHGIVVGCSNTNGGELCSYKTTLSMSEMRMVGSTQGCNEGTDYFFL